MKSLSTLENTLVPIKVINTALTKSDEFNCHFSNIPIKKPQIRPPITNIIIPYALNKSPGMDGAILADTFSFIIPIDQIDSEKNIPLDDEFSDLSTYNILGKKVVVINSIGIFLF